MIPVSLEFEAFGPFLKKQKIDFTAFDDSRIFLISGPTGSGKTTIFDAITYCLYGKASGALRAADTLKSDFADPSVVCYASFTFLIHEKQYTVLREPAQLRPKQRGEGLILKPASAQLSDETNVLATQVSQVNEQIESLLSLNFDQFCKIVMLPQGEFRRFLSDSSDEKQKILRQIFSTSLLNDFTEQLKQNASQSKTAQESLYAQCTALVQTLLLEPSTPLAQECERTPYDFNAILSALRTQNEQAAQQLARLNEQRTAHSQQLRALNIDSARQLFDRFSQYDTAKKTFAALSSQRDEMYALSLKVKALASVKEASVLEDAKSTAEKRYTLLIYKNTQAALQKEESEKRLKEARQVCDHTRQAAALLPQKNETLLTLRTQLEQRNQQDAMAALQRQTEKALQTTSAQIETFNTAIAYAQIKSEQKENKEAIAQNARFFEAVRTYQSAHREAANASVLAADTLKQYLAAQAGILADTLQDDLPCPVCGSTHHPKKAVLPTHAPTREEVDQRADYEKSARSTCESAYRQMQLLCTSPEKASMRPTEMIAFEQAQKHALEETAQALSNACAEYTIPKPLADMTAEALMAQKESLQQQYAKTAGQIAALKEEQRKIDEALGATAASAEEMKSQIERLFSEIQTIEQKNKQAENALQTAQTEYAQLCTLLEQTAVQVQEFLAQCKEAKEAFTEALHTASLTLEEYVRLKPQLQSLQTLSQKVEEYRAEYQTQKRLVRILEDALKDASRPDLSALERQAETIQSSLDAIESDYERLSKRTSQNENGYKLLSDAFSRFHTAQADYEQKKFFYDVANGAYTEKVNFERYVLASYFDAVIAHANLRLEQMTYSRYTLNRRTERESKNRTSGLALEVFDAYTGSARHVNSLSGGEGFKVSLSLALGLADIISETAGGIEIGTMFIDEGFGSLDSDSLDAAINCLYELQESGRYLGIISHVSELKERIPQKINIVSNTNGSMIVSDET